MTIDMTIGQRGFVIAVMYTKYALSLPGMSREDQLGMLEDLEKMAGWGVLPTKAFEAIEPCSHETAKLIGQALDTPLRDPGAHARRVAFGYNFSRDVDQTVGMHALEVDPGWSGLVQLNPSIRKAIDLCLPSSQRAAA